MNEYEDFSLFSNEFWQAWHKFDLTSKRFIAQLKREYEEEQENGKDFKRINKTQANRNYDGSLRK